jgi:hypothetical protein
MMPDKSLSAVLGGLAKHSNTTHSTPEACRACDSIDCIEPAFDDTFGTTAHGEKK